MERWNAFVSSLLQHVDTNLLDNISIRFEYGELRLNSLNHIYRLRLVFDFATLFLRKALIQTILQCLETKLRLDIHRLRLRIHHPLCFAGRPSDGHWTRQRNFPRCSLWVWNHIYLCSSCHRAPGLCSLFQPSYFPCDRSTSIRQGSEEGKNTVCRTGTEC